MGYQSKTWSLSDDVVEEIGRRVSAMIEETGAGSPNRVLRQLLGLDTLAHLSSYSGNRIKEAQIDLGEPEPPARELVVELDGDDK